MMEMNIKMTKKIYKAWDSYNRYQKWIGRKVLNAIKAQYGMDKHTN